MLNFMGLVSEIKTNMTRQRVKSVLSNSSVKSNKLCRPKVTMEAIPSPAKEACRLVIAKP